MRPLTIRAVMSDAPHTIGARQSLSAARLLLEKLGIRHLPVLDGGRLVGLLSTRDLAFLDGAPDALASGMTVAEAMSPEPYAVAPGEPLDAVAADMARKKIGSAVVVDRGKVVGLFTTVDALRVLAELSAATAQRSVPDPLRS
jgi:acetoin utilization protein AcuB